LIRRLAGEVRAFSFRYPPAKVPNRAASILEDREEDREQENTLDSGEDLE
jgi:hypothetical protein